MPRPDDNPTPPNRPVDPPGPPLDKPGPKKPPLVPGHRPVG